MTIESDDVLDNFVEEQEGQPQPRHVRSSDGRETYLSHVDLGPVQNSMTTPKLSDFNIAYHGSGNDDSRVWPIQSHRYRAPEVILGCPWAYSVDIWNLGLLVSRLLQNIPLASLEALGGNSWLIRCQMWDMLEDTSLFGRPAGETGEYDAHVHLAQMASFLGPPPPKLLEREKAYRHFEIKGQVYDSQGRGFSNMNKFWGGPFSDENGKPFRRLCSKAVKTYVWSQTRYIGQI